MTSKTASRAIAALIACVLPACATGAGNTPTAPAPAAPAADQPRTIVYVGGTKELRTYTLDPAGTLQPGATIAEPANYMAVDPTKKFLYTIFGKTPTLTAYAIDRASGTPTRINAITMNGVASSTTVAVHPSGRWLMTAHYSSGHAGLVSLRADGGVDAVADLKLAGETAHHAVLDSTGHFLFVPCVKSGHIAQYALDETARRLVPNAQPTAAGPSPRHMAFHPTRPFAYVVNESHPSLNTYRYDPATGTLALLETLSTGPEGGKPANIKVHPSGRFVYASLRSKPGRIVIYSIDAPTSRLVHTADETASGAVTNPRFFAIDPTGHYMLVACTDTDTLLLFAIDAADGTLTLKQTVKTLAGPAFAHFLTLP